MQRPIFSQKAIANGSLHAILELCGRPQLLQNDAALIAMSCVTGMLMHAQAVISCSAAAGSDAVHILKSLAPLHAAALLLHPAAEAAVKRIVMQGEGDEQVSPLLLMQATENVYSAARLFSDTVGSHVNGICLQLLKVSSGVDEALRAIVVGIAAAVYRSNCGIPMLPALLNNQRLPELSHTLSPLSRRRLSATPQGHDVRTAALHTHLPGPRGQALATSARALSPLSPLFGFLFAIEYNGYLLQIFDSLFPR